MSRRKPISDQPPAQRALPTERISPNGYRIIVALLLLFGVEFWLNMALGMYGYNLQLKIIAAALLGGLVPGLWSRVAAVRDQLKDPTPRTRRAVTITIAVVSTLYLLFTAARQHRDYVPIVHDEFSYLISARMLAAGRLWMPAHPLKYAFDSFQVLVEPVYASAYFPGVALFYAPAMLLHIPVWVVSAAISGMVLAFTYRIMTELMDGAAALLAALMFLATQMFRSLSLMTMANTPALLLGLTMTWGWLHWRKSAGRSAIGWALVIGAAAGWAAVTRPLDAVCFATPIGIAMLAKLVRQPARERWKPLAGLLIGSAPFLALQLVSNRGVTGHWFTTPFQLYADRDYPGSELGFHAPPAAGSARSPLPQKQAMYDGALKVMEQHTLHTLIPNLFTPRGRLSIAVVFGSPHYLTLLLMPVGVLGLITGRRWVVFAVLPLFLGLYSLYVFFLPHYVVTVEPALLLCILLGAQVVSRAFPLGGRTSVMLLLALIAVSVTALPESGIVQRDAIVNAVMLRDVNLQLAGISKPAVVLFRSFPDRSPHEEPVYNTDTAWPDDARVIRANDLGPALNLDLARYYARIGQNREIYRYEEETQILSRLGTAHELAQAGQPF